MTAPLPNGTLQSQQEALVNALFAKPSDNAASQALKPLLDTTKAQSQRGLQAYQANGHAVAERSLRAAFPVIDMMLGANSFNALARDLWHRRPPERGDLAHWGDALPAFLATSEQLAEAPYLADVARAEWALHRAAFAADAQPDPASFTRLTSEDPETLSLALAPGVCIVSSAFPVASLVLAHLQASPTLAEVASRLHQSQGEKALIWRQGMKPCITPYSKTAAALVGQLLNDRDLSGALDTALAEHHPDAAAFDFSHWLTEAVTQGLVIGVTSASAPPANPS
jgi:hypothetical protein